MQLNNKYGSFYMHGMNTRYWHGYLKTNRHGSRYMCFIFIVSSIFSPVNFIRSLVTAYLFSYIVITRIF